jgi:hypothetical protein
MSTKGGLGPPASDLKALGVGAALASPRHEHESMT